MKMRGRWEKNMRAFKLRENQVLASEYMYRKEAGIENDREVHKRLRKATMVVGEGKININNKINVVKSLLVSRV